MPEVMLTIQNISGTILRLGFIRSGVTLQPNETIKVNSLIVENSTFRDLENSGKLSIIDYGDDYTRFALREEITGSGGGELYTVRKVSPKEVVLRGQWFDYTLSPVPTSSLETSMIVNGVDQIEGRDYTIVGNEIHWLPTADFDISIDDDVVFKYTHT